MLEIVFAGYGGQGVLTAGLLISQMAVYKGYHATWMPTYGSAMRGGTASCVVKFGREEIYNPAQNEPDIFLAMNKPSISMLLARVKSGGTVVLNTDLVDIALIDRSDVHVIPVRCTTMAKEINHKLGANIIMAGVIVRLTGFFTQEEAIDGMNDMFNRKGKQKFEAINTEALKLGFNLIDTTAEKTAEKTKETTAAETTR